MERRLNVELNQLLILVIRLLSALGPYFVY